MNLYKLVELYRYLYFRIYRFQVELNYTTTTTALGLLTCALREIDQNTHKTQKIYMGHSENFALRKLGLLPLIPLSTTKARYKRIFKCYPHPPKSNQWAEPSLNGFLNSLFNSPEVFAFVTIGIRNVLFNDTTPLRRDF